MSWELPVASSDRKIKAWILARFAPNRRASTAKIWIGLNLLYDVIRTAVITLIFHKHGLNGWAYLILTLAFSIPFSFSSFRLSVALVEHNTTGIALYGLASIAAFYGPDIYLIVVSRHVPPALYVLLSMYVLLATFIVIRRIFKAPLG